MKLEEAINFPSPKRTAKKIGRWSRNNPVKAVALGAPLWISMIFTLPPTALAGLGAGLAGTAALLDKIIDRNRHEKEHKSLIEMIEKKKTIIQTGKQLKGRHKKAYFESVDAVLKDLTESIDLSAKWLKKRYRKVLGHLEERSAREETEELLNAVSEIRVKNKRGLFESLFDDQELITEAIGFVAGAVYSFQWLKDKLSRRGTLRRIKKVLNDCGGNTSKCRKEIEIALWDLNGTFAREYQRGFISKEEYQQGAFNIMTMIKTKDYNQLIDEK